MENNVKIPKLRFPEFSGWWENNKLGDVGSFFSGGTPLTSKRAYFDGVIPFIRSGEINSYKTEQFISDEGLKKSSAKMVEKGDLIYALYGATSGEVGISKINGAINQAILCIRTNHNTIYLMNYLRFNKDNIIKTYLQGGQGNLSAEIIKSLIIPFPSLPEQQKIASFLTSVDEKLQALKKKKTLLEQYKKGVMQKIFSQELRFKATSTSLSASFPEWEVRKLGDCLDYIQPTKYLVESTEYDNSYSTPVLTAGKTFILGYTDETHGIFNDNLPVIIFDDFTTSTQFVNFPFKAKSSAMKILVAKENVSIKFIYEAMQVMKYEIGGHERHWISKFAVLDILVPSIEEQTKIANFLSAIDDKIQLVQGQVEKMEVWKKGLLQKMFV